MSIQTAPLPTRVGAPELCGRCDQTVAAATTKAGKRILMDFHPSQLGRFVIVGERDGRVVVAAAARFLSPEDERPRFSCHWDHCRGHARASRRSYGRPGVNLSPFAG